MKKLLTSLTGSLVTVALIASCSPATQQPTSSDSAAASSASGIRIVKDWSAMGFVDTTEKWDF